VVGELGGGCVVDADSKFSQKILDISMAEIESAVEPDSVGNNIWRKSVPLIGIHGAILAISPS
jgi:hypothetical protein